MSSVKLEVKARSATGKGGARKVRQSGGVPGVVYGSGEPIAISVGAPDFDTLLRRVSSGNAIIDLELRGAQSKDLKALIKEVQRDPITTRVLHVDFQHIDMARRVRVRVPVVLHGSPVGVKEGGLLEHGLRELEVECLPADIPADIRVSVESLDKGQSIHVRDLSLDNVTFLDAADAVVAAIVAKGAEEPAAAAATATEAPAAEAAAPAKGAPAAGKAAASKPEAKAGGKEEKKK